LAAAEWVEAGREDLNRINVFPVPDGDTGTNFAMTLKAVAQSVDELERASLPDVTKAMADACVLSAHGNSGMLLSHFLLGFRDSLGNRETAGPADVARGIRTGADRILQALDEPVEGTILTVCRETASVAEGVAESTKNFHEFMKQVVTGAQHALEKTPELLAALREAHVVDAGAKAFVRLLEGILRLIEGHPTRTPEMDEADAQPEVTPFAAAATEVAKDRDFQYCTEVLVRGNDFPSSTDVRAILRKMGGSIVVLCTGELLKVHVHTDTPQKVFELAESWGTLEATKADDMREQHEALHQEETGGCAIVVDSTCDLTDEDLDKRGFVVTPLQISDGDRNFLDRVDLKPRDIYAQMRDGGKFFTTSQPTPGAFAESFRDARAANDRVLCISLSSGLSGTFNSAQAAGKATGLDNLTVFDSRTASLGLGFLALKAKELLDSGATVDETVEQLTRIRDRSGGVIVVDTLENLVRSGRLSWSRGWLARLLNLKPILELTPEKGKISAFAKVRGREQTVPKVLDYLEKKLTPRPKRFRIGIVHVDAEKQAEELQNLIVDKFSPDEILLAPAAAVLGVHVGIGAWAVFFQIDEPAAT